MDLHKDLILINGYDKTSEIKSCYYKNNKYSIIFLSSSKVYRYNYINIKWLRKPIKFNPEYYRISKDNKLFYGVEKILQFDNYLRVFFKDGTARVYHNDTIHIEKNSLSEKKSENCLKYFKKLAGIVSLVNDDGISILAKQYEKISFVPEKTALSVFLSGATCEKIPHTKSICYPFGCNLSQMSAVEKALSNNVSVIEGPPGTGKTQTILNIIANIIIDNKNVAVVSGNNSATINIAEKLQKYGFGFIVASLGKSENKKDFIESQSEKYPCFDDYTCTAESATQKQQEIVILKKELANMLALQNKGAKLKKQRHDVELESNYFNDYFAKTHQIDSGFKGEKLSSSKALSLLLDIEKYENTEKKFSIFFKLKHLFISGITDFTFYKYSASIIIVAIQSHYYMTKINELTNEIDTIENSLKSFNFTEKMSLLSKLSLDIFKNSLYKKYAGKSTRKVFTQDDLWKNSAEFNKEYPVVLSTTYSIKSSLEKSYLFDYLIVDEASQVDLITGVLSLSCAKNVIIVGDTKQLPNVITEQDKRCVEPIFKEFLLDNGYEYLTNSLLSSVCSVLQSVPRTLLREHYRCHPKIIEFCNTKFYNNELITMTQDDGESGVIKAYKTVAGNHARGHINQRQIDEIKHSILPPLAKNFNLDEIGIIAPYKKQTEQLQDDDTTTGIDISTVHKFQGREKDAIIITTVDNEITEFTDNPNMLNVAVSRAKKSLCIVLSDSDKNENTNIGDLVRYI